MGAQFKIMLVEEKIQSISLSTIAISIIMTLKQEMDVANNVWRLFRNQINLVCVKYLKKSENLNYLTQDVKYVTAMDVIHKTKGQEVTVGQGLVIIKWFRRFKKKISSYKKETPQRQISFIFIIKWSVWRNG